MKKINQILAAALALACFQPNVAHASFFSKEDFAVAVGAEYLSLLERRGIIVYNSYQVIPIYSIDLFNPDLQLVGSTLNYRWRSKERDLTLRTRFNLNATGDTPLYITNEKKSDRVRRTSTSELEGFFEWRACHFLELNGSLSQDLSVHKGTHGELGTMLILGNFFQREGKGAMLQPAIFGSLGAGTKKYSEYFYGSGAKAGIGHYAFGFSISSPAVIDTFYPVFKITRLGLLGNSNRSASFVRANEKDFWQVLALVAFRVW